MNTKIFNKKWTIPVLVVIIVVIVLRLFLPSITKHYVNKTLNGMEGYTGYVADIDIHLYRGAYSINDISIQKKENGVETPFFEAGNIDLSVEWKALFNGAIVGEIVLNTPVLNFAVEPTTGEIQSGEENDWIATVKGLMPLQINRFDIRNGTIEYVDTYTDPKVDLKLSEFNATALNLTNANANEGELPSWITANSKAIGGGNLDVQMDLNALKEIPDFDLNITLENVDLTSLNDYLKAYAKLDVERGNLNFYSEVTLVDGQLDGYAKPLVTNMKLLRLKEGGSFFSKLWEGLAGLFVEIFTNQPNDKLATKIPIQGSLEQFDTSAWGAITSMLKNAYIKPFKNRIDETIEAGE